MPHLELAHHPIHNNQTYDEYIGDAALHRKGAKKWSRRVHKTIAILRSLVHYDLLHIGGGNASKFIDSPADVKYWVQPSRSYWRHQTVGISATPILTLVRAGADSRLAGRRTDVGCWHKTSACMTPGF